MILNGFSNTLRSAGFHLSQTAPRRHLQLRYLREISQIDEAPEGALVDRIPAAQLTLDEAMFVVHLRGILLDDYFMPDIDVAFAKISHSVAIHVEKKGDFLFISITRDMPAARMVVESYRAAPEVFHGFVIDFVRQHFYLCSARSPYAYKKVQLSRVTLT
jgi:molecular chaperone HtpG